MMPSARPGNTKQLLACAGRRSRPAGVVRGRKGEPLAYTALPPLHRMASSNVTSALLVGLDRASTSGLASGPPRALTDYVFIMYIYVADKGMRDKL